jgi:hypothetical protein
MTTKEAMTTPGTHYVIFPAGLPLVGGLVMPIDSSYASELASEFMEDAGVVSLQVYTCGYPINERFHVTRGIIPGTRSERPAYAVAR